MLDDKDLEHDARMLMYELMMVLYRHGITEVHVGGLMRILGVNEVSAQQHDDELVILDDKFAKYVNEITQPRNSGQTLH